MVRINEQLRIELEKTQSELENSKNIKLQKQMKVMRKLRVASSAGKFSKP